MKKNEYQINRRQLIKTLGLGAVGFGIAGCKNVKDSSERIFTGHGRPATWQKLTSISKVSLVKGNDCRDNMFNALMNIEDDIMASLEGKKRILIKPNFVNTNLPLCATRVEAVKAILDFLKPRWKGPIEIGESPATTTGGTFEGFKNYGYLPLEKEYGVKLSDLNDQAYIYKYVFGQGNIPTRVRIISTFLDKDQYIISAAKLKTHNSVLVTASLKNILMGSLLNDTKNKHNDKSFMHTHTERSAFERTKDDLLHFNLFHLAQQTFPDLGVVDGYEAMEGNGPQNGTPFDARLAMASLDPLALDTLATRIMGFNAKEIMYLNSMYEAGMGQGDLELIKVLGTDLKECLYKFKPNDLMMKPYNLG